MFVIDSILLSPMKGFMWIVRELHNAAQQEIKGEADQLTHRLSTLYMMLEANQVTQAEFESQEREILARLEAIEQASGDESDDIDDDDDAEDDDEDDGGDEIAAEDSVVAEGAVAESPSEVAEPPMNDPADNADASPSEATEPRPDTTT